MDCVRACLLSAHKVIDRIRAIVGALSTACMLLVSASGDAAEHMVSSGTGAFVLVDASRLPADAPQPTWIGINRPGEGKVFHLPTGKGIAELAPGVYDIVHIDFRSPWKGLGSIHMDKISGQVRFEALSDSIAYVGLFQITSTKVPRPSSNLKEFNVELREPVQLFEWACAERPDLLAALPVRIAINRTPPVVTRVKCE